MREASILIAALTLALAGCGKADNDPGPGGVTVGEARALDQAAQMIDSRQPPADLLQPSRQQWPADTASQAPEDSPSGAGP